MTDPIKVKITKIESTHSAMRTPTIVGISYGIPTVDASFIVVSEPLEPSNDVDSRIFETSMVRDVELFDKYFIVKTRNSAYKVEILD